jgi:hypothetical protein
MAQFYRTPIDIIEKVKDLSKSLTINEISKQLKISISTVKRYKTKDVDKIKLTKSQSVIRWRKRVKIKLIEYKGGKCVKCGYNKCIEALHFHHVDPKEKDFSISGKTLSFEKMKKEVDKCILVCSNCHSEIHSETNT